MKNAYWGTLALAMLLAAPALADEPKKPPPIDGPSAILKDPLLEKLAGDWSVGGKLLGQPVKQKLTAGWVLNHQFLQLHFIAADEPPKGEERYEALVYLGYDNMSERYVVHWIDVFGGRFSETLGFGKRDGDVIKLVFEYPDGPFQTTFALNEKAGTWSVSMRQKDAAGAWQGFAEESLTRVKK